MLRGGLLIYTHELGLLAELLTSLRGSPPLPLKEALEELEVASNSRELTVVSRKVHIGALFALQELITAILEDPKFIALMMVFSQDRKEMTKLWNALPTGKEDIRALSAGIVPLKISYIFINLFGIVSTPISKYKELFLGVEEVGKLPEEVKAAKIKVTRIPPDIRNSLGIWGSPRIYSRLLHMINNTIVIVPKVVPSWEKVNWVGVEELPLDRIFKKPIKFFFSIRGAPHVSIGVTYQFRSNLVKDPWGQEGRDYFNSTSIMEFLFYFRTEEWARFIVSIIRSAARSAAEGVKV